MIKYFLINTLMFMYVFPAFSQTCQPNELYDQIVSDFHSTVARRQDGTLVIWGEKKASNGVDHVLTPHEINSTNYPGLTGIPIRASLGSINGADNGQTQAILLTTTGLFAWGDEGAVISNSITTSKVFQKITVQTKADGLPAGLTPMDVKIMTASHRSLAIVTKAGEVWMLGPNPLMYGDRTSVATSTWHQVKTSVSPYPALTAVVQLRISYGMAFAVDSNNVWYTWGDMVFRPGSPANPNVLGSSSSAIVLSKPAGITNELPKMIAASSMISPLSGSTVGIAYFVLTQARELYSLGSSGRPVLGRSGAGNSWGRVQKSATENLDNVMYVSVQESDALNMCAAAITTDNNLWAWGDNNHSIIGGPEATREYLYARTPDGFTINQDKANYVEMGGHTLVYVKDGADRYCYVGHRINGSMGDGTATDIVETSLNCTNTPAIPLCSLCPATNNNSISKSQTVCEGYPVSTFDSKKATLTNNNSVFYQWQSSVIGKDTAFNNITDATDKNYAPTPLAKTTWYRRIVKNATPNCPVDSSNVIQVFVNPVPLTPLVFSEQDVCGGDSIVLNTSAAADVAYAWKGPDLFASSVSKPVIYNAAEANSGEYSVVVTDSKQCSSNSATTTITVHTIDLIVATPPAICEGRSILFEVKNPKPSWSYLWTGPDGFVSNKANPIVTNANADKMGMYTVTVRDERKCSSNESITMFLEDCEDRFTVPEGFSPNGDGINDALIIRGLSNYPNHSIVIFNRWGEKVYKAAPYNNDWQGMSQYGLVIGLGAGELLPEGTYFYLLEKNNGEEPIKGSIYLKR